VIAGSTPVPSNPSRSHLASLPGLRPVHWQRTYRGCGGHRLAGCLAQVAAHYLPAVSGWPATVCASLIPQVPRTRRSADRISGGHAMVLAALLATLTDNWPLVAEGAGAQAPAIVSLAVADVLRWWP
jgi:hypothetical protein